MISRERLEELLKEKATIYEVKYHNINPVDLSQKIRLINYKYGMISFEPSPKEKYLHHKYLKNLFETEEDAKWELEMTATRTETLKMPKWEEFKKKYKKKMSPTIAFTGKNPQCFYELFYKDKNIYIFDCDCAEYLYSKTLTKENYIEACKLCLRLFRGEEV